MKRTYIYVAILIACFIFSAPAWAQEQAAKFFTTLSDVPLKEGLIEIPDKSVSFDKPEGRIIESVARIEQGATEDIRAYYAQTLPQLGWTAKGGDSFTRNGEKLTLRFEEFQTDHFLHLMIEPD